MKNFRYGCNTTTFLVDASLEPVFTGLAHFILASKLRALPID